MNDLMQTFALIEMSITCSLVLMLGIQKLSQLKFPLAAKLLLLFVLTNLFFWRLGMFMELPLAAYVRGVVGDLSIVSTLLLWSTLLPSHKSAPLAFKWGIAIIALCFYPFALGLSMIDPYAWGYDSNIFLLAVLLSAVICALTNWTKGTWIIGLAIIAWVIHWHESANLWDYLLDPLLVIWAIFALVSLFLQKRKEKFRSGYLFRPG